MVHPTPEDTARAEETIDRAAVDRLRALQVPGQPNVLARLVHLFLADARAKVTAMVRSLDEGCSVQDVALLAHSLKSSSAVLGATRFSELCAEIELLGRDGNRSAVSGLLSHLEEELPVVSAALTDIANEQPAV